MSRSDDSWKAAEVLAAKHMVAMGMSNVVVTAVGADGGVDVHADGTAAQVKFRQAVTGRPDIQRLYGETARRGVSGLFYSLSGYSAPAVQYANETGVALFQLHPDGSVIPSNAPARHLAARAPGFNGASWGRPNLSRPSAWRRLVVDGRWYFLLSIATVGVFAFVPFIHAGVLLRDRRSLRLAWLFGTVSLMCFIVYQVVRPADGESSPPEPAGTILAIVMGAVTVTACVLFAPLRRRVYHLDGAEAVRKATTG